jgi:hypothetical protein
MLHGSFVFGKLVPEVTDAYHREQSDFLRAAFYGEREKQASAAMR